MGIFDKKEKKQTHAFADIVRGLQSAVGAAQDMLQAQQVENLSNFWSDGGAPVTQKVKLNDKEVQVPLLTLVPHTNLTMDDVEIKFKARVGTIASHSFANGLKENNTITHADLQMEMDGIKSDADDVMEITIRFKAKETPEGISRLMDEYNKHF